MKEGKSFREMWDGLTGEDGELNTFGVSDKTGCCYSSRPEAVMSWMGFCGCGYPDSVLTMLYTLLLIQRDRFAEGEGSLSYEESLRQIDAICPTDASKLLALYTLDRLGLTEHGGNVAGSWPSADGHYFLDRLVPYINAAPPQ